jgi:hypothetical protein
MDVAGRIRAQLAEGAWPDEIVARLVGEGMSEANARRIVDKIAAENIPRPGQTSPDPPRRGVFSNGGGELLSGAFFFSLGTAVTALTYGLAKPGGKYLLAYGAILGGAASIWKGLKEFEPSRGAFPSVAFVGALLVPAVGAYGLYEWKRPLTLAELRDRADAQEAREEEAKQQAAEEQKARDEVRGAQIIADHRQLMSGIVAAHTQMMDGNPRLRCQGAQFYADQKLPDEGGDLARLLETDPEPSVRHCALAAMLASGKESLSILRILERLEPYSEYRELVTHGYSQLAQHPAEAVKSRALLGLQRVSR